MQIPQQFTSRNIALNVVFNDSTLPLTTVSVLVPDQKHLVDIVFFDLDTEQAGFVADNETIADLLHTVMQNNIVSTDDSGQMQTSIPFTRGTQELRAQYADDYAIPANVLTRNGGEAANASICFVFQRPEGMACVAMLNEEDSAVECNVTAVDIPLVKVTEELLSEIISIHMRAMSEFMIFDTVMPASLEMKIPEQWVSVVKSVFVLRDALLQAYVLLNQPEDAKQLLETKKYDQLSEQQKYMVYRSVAEELVKVMSADTSDQGSVSQTGALQPTIKQVFFKSAVANISYLNKVLIEKLLQEESLLTQSQTTPTEAEIPV